MALKSSEGLSSQLSSTEQMLGSEFFPNDEKRAEVLDMDVETIKSKYPYRYEQYLKLIKEARAGGAPEEELISVKKYIALINNLEEYIASYEKDKPEGFLREHQQDVFHKIAEFLNKGHKAGYLDLPTGFGKTVLFVELVKALSKEKEGKKNGLKALVLVPTQDLITQTIGKHEDPRKKEGFAKFAPEIKATPYYTDEKDLSGDVIVATYQSFINLQKEYPKFTEQFDLVILDEAHRALGPVTKEQIQAITPNALKIGCTATSEYNDARSVTDILPELIHKMEVKEAVELDILANPRGFLYQTNIKIENTGGNQPDYPASVLRVLNQEARNQVTVDFVKTFVAQGLKGLVPCLPGDRGEHARQMAERIANETIVDSKTEQERKIVVRSITEGTEKDQRDNIYEQFKNGEIDCLTYIDILTTGKDLPNAKFLVRCRPRKSKVESTQEIGRILRHFEDLDPYIVEIQDQFPTGSMPYTIFDLFEIEEIEQGQSMVKKAEIIMPSKNIASVTLDTELVEMESVLINESQPRGIDRTTIPPVLPEEELLKLMEREERHKKLIAELLGKMKVEARLVRELSHNSEFKKVDFNNSEEVKILLSHNNLGAIDFGTYSLNAFRGLVFGGGKSGFRQIKGESVLINFGNGKVDKKNLSDLLKFIGLEVKVVSLDYNNKEHLKLLLDNREPKVADLTKCTMKQFMHEIKFGGGNSGFSKVNGQTILYNFGNGELNYGNLKKLFEFVGVEVKEKDRKVDYSDPDELKLLLAQAQPAILDLGACPLPQFVATTFGGGDSGFAKITGQTIIKNYGDQTPNRKNFAKLLKFLGFEVGQIVDFSKPDELRFLLSNSQPRAGDLSTYSLKMFVSTMFGGGNTGYAETSGRAILSNFGNRKANYENLKELLIFLGII